MNATNKPRSSISLRRTLHAGWRSSKFRRIPWRLGVSDRFLRQVAIAMLSQAAADAEVLGRAIKIKLLNDPVLYERVKFKYQWSKTTIFRPEKEIQKIVEWSWGQQYGFLIDYLDLEDCVVRNKLEELMHIAEITPED